jgi:hypothetical protein
MVHIGLELGGHFGGRQLVIHQPVASALCGMPSYSADAGILDHDHATLSLDRPHPLGAVAAGPGKDDADGAFVPILRQAAKEKINRETLPARRSGLQQLEPAVEQRHVTVGRNNIGAIGLDGHPVFNLAHLHARIPPDKVGEHALVIRRQMLHQDKGHAGIRVGG